MLRRFLEMPDEFEVVGINDFAGAKTFATLFKYNSVYGPYSGDVDWDDQNLIVDGRRIVLESERDPRRLRWGELGTDVVIDNSLVFGRRQTDAHPGYDSHLTAGARKVIFTILPRDGADLTCVLGVNDDQLTPEHTCVSVGTPALNALAPVAKVLNDRFGVVRGFMTSLHQHTSGQVLHDSPHRDPHLARSATQNVIARPQTGTSAVGVVIPELKGKLSGMGVRLPVSVAGMIDLTVETPRPVTAEGVNAAMKEAAEGPLRGVMDYTEDPIVSSDVRGDPHSAVIAGRLTRVLNDTLLKVIAWYDYEWAYCCRCVDLTRKLGRI